MSMQPKRPSARICSGSSPYTNGCGTKEAFGDVMTIGGVWQRTVASRASNSSKLSCQDQSRGSSSLSTHHCYGHHPRETWTKTRAPWRKSRTLQYIPMLDSKDRPKMICTYGGYDQAVTCDTVNKQLVPQIAHKTHKIQNLLGSTRSQSLMHWSNK